MRGSPARAARGSYAVATFAALLTALGGCPAPAREAPATLRIGYMICNSEEETLRRFRPLTAYLSRKLGVRFEAVAIDTVDYLKRVEELDFTHTNSLLYVNMHRFHGVEVMAGERSGSLGSRARGTIVTLADSGLERLADLKDKRMVFGPTLGPVSFMAQVDLLQNAGLDPDRDLALYAIPPGSFKHEKVVYGVLFGKYDAGAVPEHDLERMVREHRIAAADFRVLARSEAIPYCSFARTQRVSDALADEFTDALVELDADTTVELDGEVVKVLGRASIDGFERVEDSAYDPVREMAKRTNMPPYQAY